MSDPAGNGAGGSDTEVSDASGKNGPGTVGAVCIIIAPVLLLTAAASAVLLFKERRRGREAA